MNNHNPDKKMTQAENAEKKMLEAWAEFTETAGLPPDSLPSPEMRRAWIRSIMAGVEEEREACAVGLDEEVKRLRELASNSYKEGGMRGPSMYSRVKWAAEICEKMAEKIRARGDK